MSDCTWKWDVNGQGGNEALVAPGEILDKLISIYSDTQSLQVQNQSLHDNISIVNDRVLLNNDRFDDIDKKITQLGYLFEFSKYSLLKLFVEFLRDNHLFDESSSKVAYDFDTKFNSDGGVVS